MWWSLHESGVGKKCTVISLVTGLIGLSVFISCQSNPYSQGEAIYKFNCENCHMEDGSGLKKLIPAIDSVKLNLSDPGKLVCLIRNGRPINKMTGQEMPANKTLNEVELANLINFLGVRYASRSQTVRAEDVKKMLASCQSE